MLDEGYIKFNCEFIKEDPLAIHKLSEINLWRNKLYRLGLIGADTDGVGFGNISIRYENNTFIITGSATGTLAELNENDYVLVETYDFMNNSLTCRGPVRASSESLSHAAVYDCSPDTMAVIHVHHLGLWEKLIDTVPTTEPNISYGTPEMANDIKRLFRESDFGGDGIIAMGGHQEGIIFFGRTLATAGNMLSNKFSGPTE